MRRLGIALIVTATMQLSASSWAEAPAMKGWELYSWLEGGELRFALHLGTNRGKSCAEVKNPQTVKTLPELDMALIELARTPGEEIIWEPPDATVLAGACALAYPPPEIVARIHRRIRELGIFELR
jgi:hypothetical protein